jgi:hypothetical protein
LTDGAQQSLAVACKNLDPQQINRVLFDSCGITGDAFAKILGNLSHLTDFKSVIYKRNELTN